MEILLIVILVMLAVSAINVVSLYIGARLGQKVAKGEPIEVKLPDPMQKIREREDKREAQREQDRYDTIMRNIEAYDGTSRGQEDVPRG